LFARLTSSDYSAVGTTAQLSRNQNISRNHESFDKLRTSDTNYTVCQGSVSVLAGASPDWVKVSHQPSTDSHMLVR